MRTTYIAKIADVERKWYVVDATDKTLGRLASEIATILRGKNKPMYAPNIDAGDYVIVINAEKVAVTGNSRFGCWICTMVKEDKSLKAFIEKGEKWLEPLREYRDWLLSIRENPEYREKRRRNGSVYEKENGQLGFGSFNMNGRKRILEELLVLEERTHLELITIDELRTIDRMWEKEGDLNKRTLVDLYFNIKGKRLPWDEYRVPLFSADALDIVKQTCEEFDIEYDMLAKLVVAIENNKHYTRGQKVNKAFDKVVNEGWLHYENIKKAKEDINNED